MASLGVPLLILGAAGGYALYKEVVFNKVPSATDGGPYNPTVSDNSDVKAGVAGTIPINGGGAITNPTPKAPIPAGRDRNTMALGGNPFKNTSLHAKSSERGRKSAGTILYAPGLKQHGAKEKRTQATQTKKTPETADVGLPRPPDSLSGVMNAHKHGPGGARTALHEASSTVKYLQKRHPGVVPDNWSRYDSVLAADPQADDFFREGRDIREVLRFNTRHGRTDGPRITGPGKYNITPTHHKTVSSK